MSKGQVFSILVFSFFLSFVLIKPVVAQSDLIPGSQSPKATLDSIWEPVVRFINSGVEIVSGIIDHLLDFEWLRSKVVGFFNWMNDLVQRITGRTLGEILRLIGDLLINIFNLMIEFARKLWPF